MLLRRKPTEPVGSSGVCGWQILSMLTSLKTYFVIRYLVNLVIVIVETDVVATYGSEVSNTYPIMSTILRSGSAACFLEVLARFFVFGSKLFHDGSRVCDFLIVMTDVLNLMVSLLDYDCSFAHI